MGLARHRREVDSVVPRTRLPYRSETETGGSSRPREHDMTQPLFQADAPTVARVALPVPIDELFEYAVPRGLERRAQPGCRVRVQFRDRPMTGVIVERASEARFAGRLRPLEHVVDAEPALSGAMLALLREAAADVLCPLGIALATALPAGSAPRIAVGYEITQRGRSALASGAAGATSHTVLEALGISPKTLRQLSKLADGRLLDALESDGFVARTSVLLPPTARVATVRVARVVDGIDVPRVIAVTLARAPQQAAFLDRLARAGETTTASLSKAFRDAPGLLRKLVER